METGAILEKRMSIANVIIDSASNTVNIVKTLPNTSKFNRSVFSKAYNRRPMNKQKRAAVKMKMAISSTMSAMQIAIIISAPVPRFKKASS